MTYANYENSPYSGTPQRLFLFESGNEQWSYVNTADSVVRGAVTYEPETIAMDNIIQNLGEGPPSVDINMSSGAAVAQQFIPYQPNFPLAVTVFRRHRDDPDSEYIVEFQGDVAATSFDEDNESATFQCRMVSSNVDRKVPWPTYQYHCNYATYGAGCGVNKEDYKVVTVVDDVFDDKIVAAGFATQPDTWFRAGFVRRDATGEVRFVINHIGNQITLQTPFVELDVGEDISIFAGDDHSYATCVSKFNNGARYFGFEWVPLKNPFAVNVYGTGTPAGGGASSNNSTTGSLIRVAAGGG